MCAFAFKQYALLLYTWGYGVFLFPCYLKQNRSISCVEQHDKKEKLKRKWNFV